MLALISYYQEDFFTPNNKPLEAKALKAMRDKRNLRRVLRERKLKTHLFLI